VLDAVRAVPGVTDARHDGPDGTHLAVQVEDDERIPVVVRAVVERGGQVMRVQAREHTLEDVYFELQGEPESQPAMASGTRGRGGRR